MHIQKDKREGLGSHMEKCVFIGYPQGYKGWKFYNPTTKKVVTSERADFDERYFPMCKVESTPSTTQEPVTKSSPAAPKPDSNPYYFPPDSDDSDSNSDDESYSDESLDHGGDNGPPAPPAVDAVAPAPAPERPQTSPRPASPVAPPRPPSPVGIGARLPRRTRNKPREWWKLSAARMQILPMKWPIPPQLQLNHCPIAKH